MRLRKKYALAWTVLAIGGLVVFFKPEQMGEWTAFGGMILTAFGIADVADKKLNGGQY